jgi:ribulose-phosphate 3-epimerase
VTDESCARPVRLGAALFNGDHGHLADEVRRLETAGLDLIHLDVFDGYFVSDLGFPVRTIASLRPLTKLPFEVHVGVMEPRRFIAPLVEAGADLILLHVESVTMPYEALFHVRQHNVRAGLAVTLGTPVSVLEPVIADMDAVLLLSRVTGEGVQGASFDGRVLAKVRSLAALVDAAGAQVDIQVAGGVKAEHVADLVAAGATTLAVGGGIYRVPDMAQEVAHIRRLIDDIKMVRG